MVYVPNITYNTYPRHFPPKKADGAQRDLPSSPFLYFLLSLSMTLFFFWPC